MRAVIIGAGIGGLAAAVGLHRVGVKSLILERADSTREIDAGLSIWSNAVNALRELGVESRVTDSASVIERNSVRAPAGRVFAINELEISAVMPAHPASPSIAPFCNEFCLRSCRRVRYEPVRAASLLPKVDGLRRRCGLTKRRISPEVQLCKFVEAEARHFEKTQQNAN